MCEIAWKCDKCEYNLISFLTMYILVDTSLNKSHKRLPRFFIGFINSYQYYEYWSKLLLLEICKWKEICLTFVQEERGLDRTWCICFLFVVFFLNMMLFYSKIRSICNVLYCYVYMNKIIHFPKKMTRIYSNVIC